MIPLYIYIYIIHYVYIYIYICTMYIRWRTRPDCTYICVYIIIRDGFNQKTDGRPQSYIIQSNSPSVLTPDFSFTTVNGYSNSDFWSF